MTNTVEETEFFNEWKDGVLNKIAVLMSDLAEYERAVEASTVEDWLQQDLPVEPESLVEVL